MDKVTIATIMVSAVVGVTHASDFNAIKVDNSEDIEMINLLRAKGGDIILTDRGQKIIGLIDGDPTLSYSFGNITFPKKNVAMILQDLDDPDKLHIVTTSGQSYVGSAISDSIQVYSVDDSDSSVKYDSFAALLPIESGGIFEPDRFPLYSIRMNNGDRLTVVITEKQINIKDGYGKITISPQQIVKLSKSEGIQFKQANHTERKFGSYVSDQYLTVVIPASDQHFKLQWANIDKVQKYDPIYDEETFEAIATVLKPLYDNAHTKAVWTKQYKSNNQQLDLFGTEETKSLQSIGYIDKPSDRVAVDINEKVYAGSSTQNEEILDQSDSTGVVTAINVETMSTADEFAQVESSQLVAENNESSVRQIFDEELDFGITDEFVVTDFEAEPLIAESTEEVTSGNLPEAMADSSVEKIEQLFSEEADFGVSDEFVVTDFEGEPLIAESAEEVIPDDLSEMIADSSVEKIEQLFSEEADFGVSDEFVVTDFEGEPLIAESAEEVTPDDLSEMIADSSVEELEQLFSEEVDFGISDELAVTDFDVESIVVEDIEEILSEEACDMIADNSVEELEQLFSEEADFGISDELVVTDLDVESNVVENIEEILSEETGDMIADNSVKNFEQLFTEDADFCISEEVVVSSITNEIPNVDDSIVFYDTEPAQSKTIDELADDADDLIALNDETITKGVPKKVIDELHDMLMNSESSEIETIQNIEEETNENGITTVENEVIDISISDDDDELLPEDLLNRLDVILSDGWENTAASEDYISQEFAVIKENVLTPESTIKPFVIGKNLVTNAEYNEFAQATLHAKPVHWSEGKIPEGKEGEPITNISSEDAKSYAKWKKMRLPTREEIETAIELGLIVNDEDVDEWMDTSSVTGNVETVNTNRSFRLAEDVKNH